MDPSQLSSAVTARIPTRTNRDDRYFTDSFQKMPAEGYTRIFERMLDHPGIDLELGIRVTLNVRPTAFAGPEDV